MTDLPSSQQRVAQNDESALVLIRSYRETARMVGSLTSATGSTRAWRYWHGGGASLDVTDVATIKLGHPAEGGRIFRIRSTLPPPQINVGMVGYPLGNRLSLNQGKLVARGWIKGAPMMLVKMLGAWGASGSPYIDDAGRVLGILQTGHGGSKDAFGEETGSQNYGLDLVRWWTPRSRLELCHAYPNGGIAGCPGNAAGNEVRPPWDDWTPPPAYTLWSGAGSYKPTIAYDSPIACTPSPSPSLNCWAVNVVAQDGCRLLQVSPAPDCA
jgi:Trypsin-like peptidase domain